MRNEPPLMAVHFFRQESQAGKNPYAIAGVVFLYKPKCEKCTKRQLTVKILGDKIFMDCNSLRHYRIRQGSGMCCFEEFLH